MNSSTKDGPRDIALIVRVYTKPHDVLNISRVVRFNRKHRLEPAPNKDLRKSWILNCLAVIFLALTGS